MKLPDQMVGLAEEIIDRMSGEFEPDKFEDRYENAMIELIRSKQAPTARQYLDRLWGEPDACQRRQPDGCAKTQHRSWGWESQTWEDDHKACSGRRNTIGIRPRRTRRFPRGCPISWRPRESPII
jgi:hypothetical protein